MANSNRSSPLTSRNSSATGGLRPLSGHANESRTLNRSAAAAKPSKVIKDENSAAAAIQRNWRAHHQSKSPSLSRGVDSTARFSHRTWNKEENTAARTIQRNWRAHRQQDGHENKFERNGAVRIRKPNSIVPQVITTDRKIENSRYSENEAAIVIQRNWKLSRLRQMKATSASGKIAHHKQPLVDRSTGYARILPCTEPPAPYQNSCCAGFSVGNSDLCCHKSFGCCLCLDGSPMIPELHSKARGGVASAPEVSQRWGTDLCRIATEYPCSCVLATFLGPCYACYVRHVLLEEHLERYICCQGVVSDNCECSCCRHLPLFCMTLESFLCCPCAVGGNRQYLQTRIGGQIFLPDPCDNRIMRWNNCWHKIMCGCNCWICCPLSPEHGQSLKNDINRVRTKMNFCGLSAYLLCLPCIQVQTLKQNFARENSDANNTKKLAELPRWWGDRLAGEMEPGNDGGLQVWLDAHDPRSGPIPGQRRSNKKKRLITSQPKKSNRIHPAPLHPLHPLTPHLKELKDKDIPDPTKEPDEETAKVHALWATSHVNRSAWKKNGWIDAETESDENNDADHGSRSLKVSDLRHKNRSSHLQDLYNTPADRGRKHRRGYGRNDEQAAEEHEMRALLANATARGERLAANAQSDIVKRSRRRLSEDEAAGIIQQQFRKYKSQKHGTKLGQRGVELPLERSRSSSPEVEFSKFVKRNTRSDESLKSHGRASPRISGRGSSRNDHLNSLEESGDFNRTLKSIDDLGQSSVRTVRMPHQDAVDVLKRSHFEHSMSPIRNLEIRTNRTIDNAKTHRKRALDEYFAAQ